MVAPSGNLGPNSYCDEVLNQTKAGCNPAKMTSLMSRSSGIWQGTIYTLKPTTYLPLISENRWLHGGAGYERRSK